MKKAFTTPIAVILSLVALCKVFSQQGLFVIPPYVSDRAHIACAQDLIAMFGALAPLEAAVRANHSRTLGNHIHFCKWREVARLIDVFTCEPEGVTLH